jgi:hypothetical protein
MIIQFYHEPEVGKKDVASVKKGNWGFGVNIFILHPFGGVYPDGGSTQGRPSSPPPNNALRL